MSIYSIPNRSPSPIRRIAVLNSKGGCGKSLIATNLASYYALHGHNTALVDHDPLGASIRWLSLRDKCQPPIHGINASQRSNCVTRSWQMRLPPGTARVIIDTPAGVRGFELGELVRQTDLVIIPVLPSDADIHSSTGFIAELLLDARIRASGARVGVVANRIRENTRVFRALHRFLLRLDFPFVAALRDAQSYVRAAEKGIGIHEVRPPSRVKQDVAQWSPLINWIEHGHAHHQRGLELAG